MLIKESLSGYAPGEKCVNKRVRVTVKTLGPNNPIFEFSVGEDARAITIADVNVQLESFDLKHRIAAAQEGHLILIQLPEDGGICGRFKFGELDSREEQNWVARSTRLISIPTGEFAIDGGGFFGEQIDSKLTESVDFMVAQVPAGQYELTCYVYICSDIATDLFRKRKLSYVQWYLETHLDAAVPGWLVDLAEGRDNDYEEEQLETLSQSNIDYQADDSFVELLFQLKPVRDHQSIAETEVSSKGKLKWEKRLTSVFPTPIFTLEAIRRHGTAAMAKLLAKAFFNKDFALASTVFVDRMQSDIARFLETSYASISQKMPIPSRVIVNPSFADAEIWLEKTRLPNVICNPKQIERSAFAGSRYVRLDNSSRYQDVYVAFHLGFVATDSGNRAYVIEMTWQPPKTRSRRRIKPAQDSPNCNECGEQLKTAKAKQCLSCGASWH